MEELPFEDRTVPRVEIDWDRSLWWWYPITRAIHPAIRWTSLLVGFLGMWLLQLGLKWGDTWFSPAYDTQLLTGWSGAAWMSLPRWELQGRLPEITVNNAAYFTFVALWIALISGTLGGVLARRSAIELGQRNMASWIQAVNVSARRLVSSLWAAGMYLVAILALLVPIVLLGWLARLGTVAAAISGVLLLTICIPVIFATGKTLLSLIICFPLSICAINVEKKADAFEGFSRSNAYLFQRPVVSVLIIVGLLVFGEVGAFLVYWAVQLGWGMVSNTFLMAANSHASALEWNETVSWLAANLVDAFRFSYFWSATAALYLVLRRSVDDTELDEMEMFDSELVKQLPQIPGTSQADSPSQADDTPPPNDGSEPQAPSSVS